MRFLNLILFVTVAVVKSQNTSAPKPMWNYKNFYAILNTKTNVFEREDQVIGRMNNWITDNNITVSSIETLTRPVDAFSPGGKKLLTIWSELVAATHAMKGERSDDERHSYYIRYMDILRVWYIGIDIDTYNYINATDIPKPLPPRVNGANAVYAFHPAPIFFAITTCFFATL